MDDIIIRVIYDRIRELRDAFSNYEKDFIDLNNILTTGVFNDDTITILNNLKNNYTLGTNATRLVDSIISDTITIKDKILEIKVIEESLKKKIASLKDEFVKRNLAFDDFKIQDHNPFKSLLEMENYLTLLHGNEHKLDLAIMSLKEKSLAQSAKTYEKELKQNNIERLVNPDQETLDYFLAYYKNRVDNEQFCIRIIRNKDDDTISIELSNQEKDDDKKKEMTVITYTNINEASNFIFHVIYDYAKETKTKAEGIQDGIYINVLENGDTLELENFSDENVNIIKGYIDNIQASHQDSKSDDGISLNDNDKVRIKNNENIVGKVGPSILLMIVLVLVLTVSVFIATGIFNLLK